jgi:hypothetical protein
MNNCLDIATCGQATLAVPWCSVSCELGTLPPAGPKMRGSVQGSSWKGAACRVVWCRFMSSCCLHRIETDGRPGFGTWQMNERITALWYSTDEAMCGQAEVAVPRCEWMNEFAFWQGNFDRACLHFLQPNAIHILSTVGAFGWYVGSALDNLFNSVLAYSLMLRHSDTHHYEHQV